MDMADSAGEIYTKEFLAHYSAAKLQLLKDDLSCSGLSTAYIRNTLSADAYACLDDGNIVPACMELANNNCQASLLTRVFLLAQPISQYLAEQMLPNSIPVAVEIGILQINSQNEYVANLDLRPTELNYEGKNFYFWIVSDLGEQQTGRELLPNHVIGIGNASLALAQFTPRKPYAKVLDLGTGCGIQALYASVHSDKVVATDISERALYCTAISAALSGVNLELRQGSLFTPVEADEKFDLIVSNPPFVITPAKNRETGIMEYRDGGLDADDLCKTVVSQVADYLAPGGLAVMLINWEEKTTDATFETVHSEGVNNHMQWEPSPIKDWLDAHPEIDAWLVCRESIFPGQYAQMWLRDGGMKPQSAMWNAQMQAWIQDFTARQVAHIKIGALVIHKPESAVLQTVGWRYYDEVATSGNTATGAYILGVLEQIKQLRAYAASSYSVDNWQNNLILHWEVMRKARLQRRPDVIELRSYLPGKEHAITIQAKQTWGYGRTYNLDTVGAALLGVADGEIDLETIMQALQALDVPVEKSLLLKTVTDLLVYGFIEIEF